MGTYLEADKRINGSFGFVSVDGDQILEGSGVEITVDIEYTDVWTGLDKDAKMTGRSGTGKIKCKKAYSRAAEYFASVKSGKAPIASLLAWVSDPDLGGKTERVSISKIKFTSLPIMSFEHGSLNDMELPFRFAPGDLTYLDRVDPD